MSNDTRFTIDDEDVDDFNSPTDNEIRDPFTMNSLNWMVHINPIWAFVLLLGLGAIAWLSMPIVFSVNPWLLVPIVPVAVAAFVALIVTSIGKIVYNLTHNDPDNPDSYKRGLFSSWFFRVPEPYVGLLYYRGSPSIDVPANKTVMKIPRLHRTRVEKAAEEFIEVPAQRFNTKDRMEALIDVTVSMTLRSAKRFDQRLKLNREELRNQVEKLVDNIVTEAFTDLTSQEFDEQRSGQIQADIKRMVKPAINRYGYEVNYVGLSEIDYGRDAERARLQEEAAKYEAQAAVHRADAIKTLAGGRAEGLRLIITAAAESAVEAAKTVHGGSNDDDSYDRYLASQIAVAAVAGESAAVLVNPDQLSKATLTSEQWETQLEDDGS